MYKVLWFDDEHETLEDIKEDCLLEDIQLIGYSNAKDGLKALKEDIYRFDAVLLDGMFFNDNNQTGDPSDSAFGKVAIDLSNLKAQGIVLPWFVYSGQKNFVKDKNKMIELLTSNAFADGKVFDKNEDKDFTDLYSKIKAAANAQTHTEVRLNNIEAFEVFQLNIIEKKHEKLLLDILVSNHDDDFKKKNIIVQRDLLEAIWKALHFNIPCIPEAFFDSTKNNKPNHEWCTLFFEGRNVNTNSGQFRIDKHIPKQISGTFRVLKESVNELSHLSDNTIIKIPMLTNTYLLITLLIWLSSFVKKHYPNYI
jgi:hypothetical protein